MERPLQVLGHFYTNINTTVQCTRLHWCGCAKYQDSSLHPLTQTVHLCTITATVIFFLTRYGKQHIYTMLRHTLSGNLPGMHNF